MGLLGSRHLVEQGYPFNVQPDAQGRDKPQMSILSQQAHRITD